MSEPIFDHDRLEVDRLAFEWAAIQGVLAVSGGMENAAWIEAKRKLKRSVAILSRMAIMLDSVSESSVRYNVAIDYEHEHQWRGSQSHFERRSTASRVLPMDNQLAVPGDDKRSAAGIQPMTEPDLNNIERSLGYQLPTRYRSLLLNYPQTLIDQGEFGAANFDLYHSEGKLIEANGQASRIWPDRPNSFVIVGDNGFGEVFAIDTSDDECPVYGLSPHHGEFEDNVDAGVPVRIAETVDEWAQLLAKRKL